MPGLLRVADRLAEFRRPGREQRDGLLDVALGGGGPDLESGRELGECLAFAQVGEDKQGVLARVQLPPGRPDCPAVAADEPGREGEGLARQRQRRTVKKA